MKRIILSACAALLATAAFTACDKTAGTDDKATALADSTSTAYGTMVGNIVYSDYIQFKDSPDAPKKEELLKGVKLVFSSQADKGTLIGMQMAVQMLSEIEHIEQQGVKMDRAKVLNAFMEAFSADTVEAENVRASSARFQSLLERAVAESQATPEETAAAEAIASPASDNEEAGEVYLDMLKSENPSVMTTDSGLCYVIETPGEGAHPTATSTVVVNYTGKKIDGSIFDTSEGRGPATFPLNGVVPGFSEGLQLLGKGGKATLYIPGNLAYGANGMPQAGIGPNELLIFDVELLEIK